MSDERKLTEEEREKIQRLLESGTLENVTLALSLIEETAVQEDIAEIFTMNVIVELICLNSPESLEVMIMAGQFIRRCPETWKRFSESVVGPDYGRHSGKYNVLTSQRSRDIVDAMDVMLAGVFEDPAPVSSFNQFTLISAAAAGVIASMDYDDLVLDGLMKVSDAAAVSLSKHQGMLDLNGLTEISDAAAESLSKHEGESLGLGGLLKLSDATAEFLSKHTGSLGFRGLTALSDNAAESLSKHEGESLGLGGLTKLSDVAAAQLGSHNNLYTNTKIESQIKKAVSTRNQQARNSAKTGETALTKKQAVKLRKLFRSKDVDNVLIAVQLIDASEATQDDISDILSSSVLSQLINTWDVAIWNSLAPLLNSYTNAKREFKELAEKRFQQKFKSSYAEKHEANEFLNGFYQGLTKPLALLDLKILDYTSDSWNVGDLELDGLTELSDVAAEGFGKRKGVLGLSRLTALSDNAAESLSKHEGKLDLRGLTSLSDGPGHIALAERLSKQTPLFLDGLRSLSDAAVDVLSKQEGWLVLCGLTSLSDAAVKSLGEHAGDISLDGLTQVSDAAAEILSKHEGELNLSGLTSLTDAAAESLSKHEGEINLSGLTSLSDGPGHIALAESLSKHEGYLTLNALTSLSDAAAESLSKRETKFTSWHIELDNLPASAAKILRDAGHGE